MLSLRSGLLFLTLLPLTAAVSGQEAGTVGLAVGSQAPEVKATDHTGQLRVLSELLREGPVALVFYRSADW
jgi:hypothetical protein